MLFINVCKKILEYHTEALQNTFLGQYYYSIGVILLCKTCLISRQAKSGIQMFTVTLEGSKRMMQTAKFLPLPFLIMMLQHGFLSHSLKVKPAYGSKKKKEIPPLAVYLRTSECPLIMQ